MTTLTDDELIAQLRHDYDALGDQRDVLKTDRAQEEFHRRRQLLTGVIGGLLNTAPDLMQVEQKIARVQTWIAHLTAWRQQFTEQLATLPALAACTERKDEQRVSDLQQSISNIDVGCEYVAGFAQLGRALRESIMAAYQPTWESRDPWDVGDGSLPDAHARLTELKRRRLLAQRDLNGYRTAAEALLAPVAVPS